MKKAYVKYKILVNGLNIINNCSIDGFTLKTSKFDKKIFEEHYDNKLEGVYFNLNYYLVSCFCDNNDYSYRYFESNDFDEYDVSNKTNKNNINKIVKNHKEILNKIYDFENKLRITFNVPLLFQIINVEFYNENKEFMKALCIFNPMSCWNRLLYNLDPLEFSNNSRFHFNYDIMKEEKNNQFLRAIEFYNDSFLSEKVSIRYILIFSSLEAIFNLDGIDITEKLARLSAKLLAEDNKEIYEKIYSDIKKLYKKRCNYIHGSKREEILLEDEKQLRRYVRKIILAYWLITIYTKKNAKEIIKYLDSEEKLDVQIRLVISTLNADSFDEQQLKAIRIVEEELGTKIPEKTRESILSNCKKQ